MEPIEDVYGGLNLICSRNVIVEFYDLDGSLVYESGFSLLTKSIYKAMIEVQMLTGYTPMIISFSWVLMKSGNRRLLISKNKGPM